MSFFLHNRARGWFGFQGQRAFARSSDVAQREPGVERFLLFDAYYTCALIGLDGRRQGRAEQLEPEEFSKVYPDSFKGQAELIAGLLVEAELARQDIQPDDRASIEGEMVRLLDPRSSSRLSSEGDRLLNLYSAAGFEKIESILPPPDNLEDFLVAYQRVWAANV